MQFYKKTKALGSDFEVWLQSAEARNFEADYVAVKRLLVDFENRFSRFSKTSELSRFNNGNDFFQASPEFVKLFKMARFYHGATKGIYNPAIKQSLEILGYEKSYPFDDFLDKGINQESIKDAIVRINDFPNIIIKNNNILKPDRMMIDFGGIGKGYVVDKIAEHLFKKKYANFWVSAGGDIFLSGAAEDGQDHLVGVQNPKLMNEELLDIRSSGKTLAIATSGIVKRRWRTKHDQYHHIIDPRTGLSADNELLSVTIIAETVAKADVFAKTALILGVRDGLRFINDQKNVEGLMIDRDLKISLSRKMDSYLTDSVKKKIKIIGDTCYLLAPL